MEDDSNNNNYRNERRNHTYRPGFRGRGEGRGRGFRGRGRGFRERGRGRGRGRGSGWPQQHNNLNDNRRGEQQQYNNNMDDNGRGEQKKYDNDYNNGRGKGRGRGRGFRRGKRGNRQNRTIGEGRTYQPGFRGKGRGRGRGKQRNYNYRNDDYYFSSIINEEKAQQSLLIEEENEILKFSKQNFININNNIKFNKELLDEYQNKALEMCLNNKLCFIQGPAGTGKTYIATVIANIILQNRISSSSILIITFSDKTLAQLINNILQYRDNLIRVKENGINKSSFDVIDSSYLKIMDGLLYANKGKKILLDLINEQRKEIRIMRTEIIKRVSDDFYDIAKIAINKNIVLKRDNKLEIEIYNYWKNIGNKNNDPTEIIFKLFDSKINDEDRMIYFEKIYNNINLFQKNTINNIDNIIENENNLNNCISNLFDEEINGYKKNEKEDSENSEESEEKDKKIDNLENDNLIVQGKEKYTENNIIKEEEDSFDKKDIKSTTTSLNKKKLKFLLDSKKINFFRLDSTIIRLIIDYYKNIILLEHLNNLTISENTKIMAMTMETYKKNIKKLNWPNFESIIIEESEEMSELHILSLLTKITKQIILFGDIKQMNPKQNEDNIEKIPLLKRLINDNIPLTNLKYQRRMKPIFVEFVKIISGEESDNMYINHSDINNRDTIKGMEKDMFIIKHCHEEENDNNNLEFKTNSYEAKYLIKLSQYLLKQGYCQEQITILSFYESQVLLIMKYLEKFELNKIKIKTVNNYLGEENDFILLSLVRSNKNFDIGILNSFNEIYMSFTRAKIGFYIIGNIDCIIKGDNLLMEKYKENPKQNIIDSRMLGVWERIEKKAKELNIIGDKLILECKNHKTKTEISDYKDFKKCPEGGCRQECKKRMNCGHACEKLCHPYDCNEQKCLKEVTQKNPNCALGIHNYTKKCFENFGKCREQVKKKLLCGHFKIIKCYQDIKKIKCTQKCEKKLPCGHTKKDCICCEKIEDELCKEKCNKLLPCSHKCQGLCYECLKGTLHAKCSVKCGKILPCGHFCNQKCSSECFCNEQCQNKCSHSNCSKKCCEICIDCKENCIIGCKHEKCEKTCGELCERKPCNKRCEIIMKCGHQCYGLCGERCPEICRICNPDLDAFKKDFFYFDEIKDDDLIYKTECGHYFEVKGFDQYIKSIQNIQMYTCPQCKNLLIWEPRYQNSIKNIFSDIQKIKKLSLDKNLGKYDNTFFLKSKSIVDKILNESFRKREKTDILINDKSNEQIINIFEMLPKSMYSNKRMFEYEHYELDKKLPISYNLCKNEFKGENDINSKRSTTYNLLTLVEKFMGVEYYAYLINSKKIKEPEFLNNFNIVKRYFNDFNEQFNNNFFNDLKNKVDNMLYYSILKLNKNLNISNNLFNRERKIKSPEELVKSNFSLPLNLKDLFQGNIIDKEVIDLLKSLGTKWYKCPNGHLYTVGECGRPMEESSCPQCKEKIGGRNHIPSSGNQEINLATEIRNNNNQNNNRNIINDNRNNIINNNNQNNNFMNNQNRNNNNQRYIQTNYNNYDNYKSSNKSSNCCLI